MPLFNVELNEKANRIGRSDLTIYLHTAAPSDASPTNGRLTAGGGVFETGQTLAAGGISVAANGDITNDNADIHIRDHHRSGRDGSVVECLSR